MPENVKDRIARYERQLADDPTAIYALNKLSALYIETGDREKGIECLYKALEIKPNDPMLKHRLQMLEAGKEPAPAGTPPGGTEEVGASLYKRRKSLNLFAPRIFGLIVVIIAAILYFNPGILIRLGLIGERPVLSARKKIVSVSLSFDERFLLYSLGDQIRLFNMASKEKPKLIHFDRSASIEQEPLNFAWHPSKTVYAFESSTRIPGVFIINTVNPEAGTTSRFALGRLAGWFEPGLVVLGPREYISPSQLRDMETAWQSIEDPGAEQWQAILRDIKEKNWHTWIIEQGMTEGTLLFPYEAKSLSWNGAADMWAAEIPLTRKQCEAIREEAMVDIMFDGEEESEETESTESMAQTSADEDAEDLPRGASRLVIALRDGSELEILVHKGRSQRPFWTADGDRILFYSAPAGEEEYVLKAASRDGTRIDRISEGTIPRELLGQAVLDPQGKWLVFASGDPPNLRQVRIDGTGEGVLHNRHKKKSRPFFSRDGEKLFYYAPSDWKHEIWAIPPFRPDEN